MSSALLWLRKLAGFKNAKDFAAAIGIADATYARYESKPDKIPLKSAWQLADYFNVSIDIIVGREAIHTANRCKKVQEAYEALDPRLQQSFDDYLDYLIERNVQLRNERIASEHRRYDAACYRLEQLFYAQMDEEGVSFAFESPDKLRARFHQFVEVQADEKQEPDVRNSVDAIMDAYDRAHSIFDSRGPSHIEYAVVSLPAEKGASSQNSE